MQKETRHLEYVLKPVSFEITSPLSRAAAAAAAVDGGAGGAGQSPLQSHTPTLTKRPGEQEPAKRTTTQELDQRRSTHLYDHKN